ncbi:hypothetical protein AB1Y20_017824 [Prymnesium parvum]|uniref:Uncharacterized protein n=1 Tax=Prymnesium parvum TaxID=97485 RepID=A0AB34JPU7_PRYPA
MSSFTSASGLNDPLLTPGRLPSRSNSGVGRMARAKNPSALDLLLFESMGDLRKSAADADESTVRKVEEAVSVDALGVKYMRCANEPDKLLEYVAEQVEVSPWSVLFSETRRASVLAFPQALKSIGKCVVISLLAFVTSVLLEKEADEALSRIDGTVSAGLFFLLGPYVGLSVARWWQMRLDLVGGVWGAVADLNFYAAVFFNSGSVADREARALNLRYGLAAHALLYLGARGNDNLDELVEDGLLLPEEAAALDGLPSKSQMVFQWVAEFWTKALDPDSDFATTRSPHVFFIAPAVLKRCMDARGAAGGALALVYTQLPFPYVHLLSLLVEVACVVNAICSGAHTGYVLSEPTCTGNAVPSSAHRFRYEIQEGCPPALMVYSFAATGMIIAGWLITAVSYPIIYHGLLSIGIMVSNPLGEHFIDLPGQFYSQVMRAECKGFHASRDACETWWKACRNPAATFKRPARPASESAASGAREEMSERSRRVYGVAGAGAATPRP